MMIIFFAGPQDYMAVADTFTVSQANNGLVTVTISITDNSDLEANREFFASIAAPYLPPKTALDPVLTTITIMDDDGKKRTSVATLLLYS